LEEARYFEFGGVVLAFCGEEFDVEVPAADDHRNLNEETVDCFGVYAVVYTVYGGGWAGCPEASVGGISSGMCGGWWGR
jgi:hypothetical protein